MSFKSRLNIAIVALAMGLGACSSMPTSGPSAKAVNQLGASDEMDANLDSKAIVLDLNAQTSDRLTVQSQQNLFSELVGGRTNHTDVVGEGDMIAVTIWEAPPAVLFGGVLSSVGTAQGQSVQLPEQLIDEQGRISIPFVGQIRVSGLTTRQIEDLIVSRLSKQAHQPQAMVRQVRNNAANVTVIREGNSVRMPLTAKGERVLDAVAAIGGVKSANKTSIQLTRGDQVRSLPLLTITQSPRQNILLKSGDVVTAIDQPLSFVALGATGRNEEINFEQDLTLIQALGRMRGVNDNRANAQGVFVFRYEDVQSLQDVERIDVARVGQKVPVVYRVNLRDPNTFFYAQKFPVRDKDVIYVANAPATELQKFLRIVFSITSPITGTINAVDNIAD